MKQYALNTVSLEIEREANGFPYRIMSIALVNNEKKTAERIDFRSAVLLFTEKLFKHIFKRVHNTYKYMEKFKHKRGRNAFA